MSPFDLKTSISHFKLSTQEKVRFFIAVLVFVLVLASYLFGFFERFELVTYDYRFALKGPGKVDPRIAVIEISDDSIDEIGRWPWDRDWHATLIKILHELGAKAVLMDVLFVEPSSNSEKDALLAAAIQEAGNVYLPVAVEKSGDGEPNLIEPMPLLKPLAKGIGHINVDPDQDGAIRRVALLKDFRNQKIPQLSLVFAVDEKSWNLENVHIKNHTLLIPQKDGPMARIPLDKNNNLILNWPGKWAEVFEHFSFIQIIHSYALMKKGMQPTIPLDYFKDKICFIGGTATGLTDLRPMPLEPAYPAVGVNLTLLNNLLTGQFIKPVGTKGTVVLLILLMLILFRLIHTESYFKASLTISALAIFYLVVAFVSFIYFNLWINIVYPVTLILATYLLVSLYNYLYIAVERKKLFNMATRDSLTGLYNVGQFKLLFKAELQNLKMRPDRKLSVIFGDVDNFKKINDTYGHLTGDLVLKEVSGVMKSFCRALDVAARYGGEEMVMMLPGADSKSAAVVAEKVRKAISELAFPAQILSNEGKLFAYYEKSKTFNATISLGVAEATPQDHTIDSIIARADDALYKAKQTGKNQVIVAPIQALAA